jgi:hypothetical protein
MLFFSSYPFCEHRSNCTWRICCNFQSSFTCLSMSSSAIAWALYDVFTRFEIICALLLHSSCNGNLIAVHERLCTLFAWLAIVLFYALRLECVCSNSMQHSRNVVIVICNFWLRGKTWSKMQSFLWRGEIQSSTHRLAFVHSCSIRNLFAVTRATFALDFCVQPM